MTDPQPSVAVIGAGTIGRSFARLFAVSGYDVTVWDPRGDLAEVVAGVRAEVATDARAEAADAAAVPAADPCRRRRLAPTDTHRKPVHAARPPLTGPHGSPNE